MNNKFKIVITVLLVTAVLVSVFLVNGFFSHPVQTRPFYFRVEYAYADDTSQLKTLVDKVAPYTNVFVIGSLAISFNRTALDESCDYITQSGLSFIVLFTGLDRYNWTGDYRITNWMLDAQHKYGDKFLGIYKIDEPGGNQLDNGPSQIINDTTTYTATAQNYVGNLSQMTNYYHPYTPRILTADFALEWFDYKANYTTVLAEFVGNESRNRIIAQDRGAAAAFHKDWGVIINWKYNQPPHYLESGDELYNDLALAYSAGASYGVVFSYPNLTGSAYGVLEPEHFLAIQKFWNTLHTNPSSFGDNKAEVAYVVPADYGFGFRSSSDRIWGLFPSDSLSAKIYSDVETLTDRYGVKVDFLYDEPELIAPLLGSYRLGFFWNETVT
ncbi:MAG TPA: hypothetical protein VLH35_02190 [Candidatus Acidoferrales bacterium]|nr:hypothetical protein [Candidatus Acidoferrales bacterium]